MTKVKDLIRIKIRILSKLTPNKAEIVQFLLTRNNQMPMCKAVIK